MPRGLLAPPNVKCSLGSCWLCPCTMLWIYGLSLALGIQVIAGWTIWYQKPPPEEDPCTLIVFGQERWDLLSAYSSPECQQGGLRWYGVWSRIHLSLLLSLDRSQEFEVCLTAGLEETAYIFWDSHHDYWQPITFPQNRFDVPYDSRCRPSVNGSVDLYLEPPWARIHYLSYISWELLPLSKEEHKQRWIDLERRRKPPSEEEEAEENKEEEEANKESAQYMLGVVLTYVLSPSLVVAGGLGLSSLFIARKIWLLMRLRQVQQNPSPTPRKGGRVHKGNK